MQEGAMNINVQITTFLASINRIKAHKNKYSTFGAKLSPTPSLVQNKPRKPTNTSIAIIDLELHIYD
jgi:hypothetical protein